MKNWQTCLLLAAGLLLTGCAKKGPSEADVRKAIEEHLASRPGLDASKITMDVKNVEVKGDKAEADVVFRTSSDPNASMNFHYQLHSEGDQWKVDEGRPSSSSSPHPTPGAP